MLVSGGSPSTDDAVRDHHACIQVFLFLGVSRQIEAWNQATKGGTSPGVLWGADRETLHRGAEDSVVSSTIPNITEQMGDLDTGKEGVLCEAVR